MLVGLKSRYLIVVRFLESELMFVMRLVVKVLGVVLIVFFRNLMLVGCLLIWLWVSSM